MHVALAADRRRVAELLRSRAHRGHHVRGPDRALRGAPDRALLARNAALPRAEILRAHLGRPRPPSGTRSRPTRWIAPCPVIEVLNSSWPGSSRIGGSCARGRIVDATPWNLPLFRGTRMHPRARSPYVTVAHRRESERIVFLRVALVADADTWARGARTMGASTFRRGSPERQVGARLAADAGSARRNPTIGRTCRVAQLAPPRVVSILLAAAGIAARGLQVAARVPAIQTSVHAGRDGERLDALERGLVVTGRRLRSRYSKPLPLCRRRIRARSRANIAARPAGRQAWGGGRGRSAWDKADGTPSVVRGPGCLDDPGARNPPAAGRVLR